MAEETTTFVARVRDAGQGSLEITIPKSYAEIEEIEIGDFVKVLIRKLVDPEKQ